MLAASDLPTEQTTPRITFRDIVPSPTLLAAIEGLGFTEPTPVQAKTIPAALAGSDLIVQAKTGSGKTLAFAAPLLMRLEHLEDQASTAGLIITPTRELAVQICEVITSISSVKPACLIGGVPSNQQIRALEEDRRIIVGTPGRIDDFIRQRLIPLTECRYFVLDEADEMLSMDFVEEVRGILAKLPRQRQGLFISATISNRVESLALSFLAEPKRIIIETPAEEMPSIEHNYYELPGELTAKVTALADLLETSQPRSAIIFCNTKSDTELVEVFLRRRGFDARRINSDLSQKQRDYIMAKIRAGELRFLIGTDIAARGIDIEQIDLVVNYTLPDQPEVYVHRTGRTGRAGRSGRAVSLIAPADFGSFMNLKRHVNVPLVKVPLPTEDEVTAARLRHFRELIGGANITASERDYSLAAGLLREAGVSIEPTSEAARLMATMDRFTLENMLKPNIRSLEEEILGVAQGEGPVEREEPRRRSRSGDSGRGGRRDGRDRGGWDRGGGRDRRR
jgi:ATP-dependent RNA helicase DeaD